MRGQKKIFNFFLCLLLSGAASSVANPVDSIYLTLNLAGDTTQKRNYSNTNFCNCSEDKLAPATGKRDVNTEFIEKHKNDKDFQYERTVKDEAASFWDSFWNWLIRKIFGKVTIENAIRTKNIVFWLVGVFGVLIVAYWLYKSEFFGSPMRRSTKISSGLFDETERSEEDIELLINEALKDQNYSLAIRWVYIKCIKALSIKNEIDIRQDKTNYDYYLELKDRELREQFSKLTLIFEYTNYGNFVTDQATYNQAISIFNIINSKI